MKTDPTAFVAFELTHRLRYVERTVEIEIGELPAKLTKQFLQQAWVNGLGDLVWRDVPIEKEA